MSIEERATEYWTRFFDNPGNKWASPMVRKLSLKKIQQDAIKSYLWDINLMLLTEVMGWTNRQQELGLRLADKVRSYGHYMTEDFQEEDWKIYGGSKNTKEHFFSRVFTYIDRKFKLLYRDKREIGE